MILYNWKEAIVHADTYYTLGSSLYQALESEIKPNCDIEITWRLWPASINMAFSCEILLKLFYNKDHNSIAHGHKLYSDLYRKLSDDSKQLIFYKMNEQMKANGNENYTMEMFQKEMKQSENTFDYERYSFELVPGKGHSLQCGFILLLGKVLNELATNYLVNILEN